MFIYAMIVKSALRLIVLLIAYYSPTSHKHAYTEECKYLVNNTAKITTTNKDSAHCFYEIAYRIDVCCEIS